MAGSKLFFRINDFAVAWTDKPRRVQKPCSRCRKPTQGRAQTGDVGDVGGSTSPSCMACAVADVTDKAMRIYKAEVAADKPATRTKRPQ